MINKTLSLALGSSLLLSACVSGPSPKNEHLGDAKGANAEANTVGDDEIISYGSLGAVYCVTDSVNGVIQTRAQIREVDTDDWQAFEEPEGQPSLTRCEATLGGSGRGQAPCSNSPNPAKIREGDRIRIQQFAGGVFSVTFKHKDGSPYAELGNKGEFKAAKEPVDIQKKAKWLSAKNVPWTDAQSGNTTYDIFIYLADDTTVRNIPKHYRVEFFNTGPNHDGCAMEEPDPENNNSHLSGPFGPGYHCPNLISLEKILQEPVSDGHHRAPNAAHECVYEYGAQ